MGKIRPPEQALLFVGMLYSEDDYLRRAKEILTGLYGDIFFQSMPYLWGTTDYYINELGPNILRVFIFFSTAIDPGTLADIKLGTNGIEEALSVSGKRRINIDPGYLTLAKVVLASTKNYSHRIYIGKGIYGETTLIFKGNTFMPHIFTYQDYQDQRCVDIFIKARAFLKKQGG